MIDYSSIQFLKKFQPPALPAVVHVDWTGQCIKTADDERESSTTREAQFNRLRRCDEKSPTISGATTGATKLFSSTPGNSKRLDTYTHSALSRNSREFLKQKMYKVQCPNLVSELKSPRRRVCRNGNHRLCKYMLKSSKTNNDQHSTGSIIDNRSFAEEKHSGASGRKSDSSAFGSFSSLRKEGSTGFDPKFDENIPPDFVIVPSRSGLGYVIYDPVFTHMKYSNTHLAWEVYLICKQKSSSRVQVLADGNSLLSSLEFQDLQKLRKHWKCLDRYATMLGGEVFDAPLKPPSGSDSSDVENVHVSNRSSRMEDSEVFNYKYVKPEEVPVQVSEVLPIRNTCELSNKNLIDSKHSGGVNTWWRLSNKEGDMKNIPPPSHIPSPGYLLVDKRKRDGKFVDPHFPPSDYSLGFKPNSNVVWLRVPDLWQLNSGEDRGSELYYHGVTPNDLIQGNIGDCWLLASLASLAEFPSSIYKRITKGVDPGSYRVTLFDFDLQMWRSVLVDDYIPCEYTLDYTDVPFKWVDRDNKKLLSPTQLHEDSEDSEISYVKSVVDDSRDFIADEVKSHHANYQLLPPLNAIKVYSSRVKPKMKYQPCFAKPRGNEMWCLLIEKAVAKFVGSYSAIGKGGHEAYALMVLTGCSQVYEFKKTIECRGCGCKVCGFSCCASGCKSPSTNVTCGWERGFAQWFKRDVPKVGYRQLFSPGDDGQFRPVVLTPDSLRDRIYQYDQRNYLMACCITQAENKEKNKPTTERSADGLYPLHAYSMLCVLKVEDICLVLLRNPHGASTRTGKQSEWSGRWSDFDGEWFNTKNRGILNAARISLKRLGAGRADDGLFWMSFEDFNNRFDKIFVLAKMMEPSDNITRLNKTTGNVEVLQTPDIKQYDTDLKSIMPYTLRRMLLNEKTLHEKGWDVAENLQGSEYSQLNLLASLESMSVSPYDPYLNPPPFIAKDKPLLMQWIKDKGHSL